MYQLSEKTIELEGKKVQSYGIGRQGEGIDDISTDKYFVLQVLNLCNTMQVPLCHLLDVVDDCLAEHYGV